MKPGELPVPPAAVADESATELARAWAAQGRQHVSLAAEAWEDPAAWGIMLVDLARHVARAYEQTQGQTFESALARIREGFDAEWESPTDEPTGGVCVLTRRGYLASARHLAFSWRERTRSWMASTCCCSK